MADADHRVYLVRKDFEVGVKSPEATLYCHKGELGGGFHLIAEGEIYVHHEDVNYCLNCAVATGIVTDQRPNLERGSRILPSPSPIEPAL